MPCYRGGGCGPYENFSCSECPASRPEYTRRNGLTPSKPAKTAIKAEDTGKFAPVILKPLTPECLTMKNVRLWVAEHPARGFRFAVDLNVEAAPGSTAHEITRAMNALRDQNNPACFAAVKAVSKLIEENVKRLGLVQVPEIKFPEPNRSSFLLDGIPEVDPVMSPNQKMLQRYDLLRLFDVACQVAWYTSLSVIRESGRRTDTGDDDVPGPARSMSELESAEKLNTQLMRGIRNIIGSYNADEDDAGAVIECLLEANVPVTYAVLAVHPLTDTQPSDIIFDTADKKE